MTVWISRDYQISIEAKAGLVDRRSSPRGLPALWRWRPILPRTLISVLERQPIQSLGLSYKLSHKIGIHTLRTSVHPLGLGLATAKHSSTYALLNELDRRLLRRQNFRNSGTIQGRRSTAVAPQSFHQSVSEQPIGPLARPSAQYTKHWSVPIMLENFRQMQ